MNPFNSASRLPYVAVMLLLASQAVSAAENLRGSEVAAPNNNTLGMVYYDYDYRIPCHENDYRNDNREECARNLGKQDVEKRWTQVWVKVQDKNLAISGVISSYGLFVDYAEGGRLDWSGTLTIGSSTFPYTKVDGVAQTCKKENNVPTNLKLYYFPVFYEGQLKTMDVQYDDVLCLPHGRLHTGAKYNTDVKCLSILNQNTGEFIPAWSTTACYYKTLDDVKSMTRLLTPEQVMSCYGESGWDNDRVC